MLKVEQRVLAAKKRKEIFELNRLANKKLFNILKESDLFLESKIIASYSSIRDEIQTEDLNRNIISSGKTLCLPSIEQNNNYLLFRIFNDKTLMKTGKFDIKHPDRDSKCTTPDLLLVPCLCFDQFGHRIGYGGGYYDRTLKKLKLSSSKFKSVIVAFNSQEIDKIKIEDNDQKIDYILTEDKLRKSKLL